MAILLQIHNYLYTDKSAPIQRKATLVLGEKRLYICWKIDVTVSQDSQRGCGLVVVGGTLIESKTLYGLPEAF